MAERINKEELRNVLVRNFEMTEEQAANVLERFFGLIIKALETDRYVKVKGLGIFKPIDVEPHRIVNVNTGESVDTQGYKKVAFVPDATLKEVVNKPFAHFETVALRDGVGMLNVNLRRRNCNRTISLCKCLPLLERLQINKQLGCLRSYRVKIA